MFQKHSETMFILWLTRRSLCSLMRLPSKIDSGCFKTRRGVPGGTTSTVRNSRHQHRWLCRGQSAMQTSLMEYGALVQQQQALDLLLFCLLRHSLFFFFSSTINIPFGLYASAMTSLPRILRECVTSSATRFSQEIVPSQTKLHRATAGIQGVWEWEW